MRLLFACLALQPSQHSVACGAFLWKGNKGRSHVASAPNLDVKTMIAARVLYMVQCHRSRSDAEMACNGVP